MIMAVSPKKSACLDLSISVPGSYTSPLSLNRSSGDEGGTVTMRDLDINQMPSEIGEDDQWTTGSMDLEEDDNLININNDQGAKGPPRKKLRLTKEQSRLLEESFRHNHTLNPKQKETLAMELKLKPRQVEVWFQNRRARSKLKQTEMECEYLKRWFGSLTEQNKRLQKEVEELRAMKVGAPTVMTPHSCDPLPASTLTMCPQCERVSSTGHDKGPTRNTTTSAATAPTNPTTLSAKIAVAHSRHPSATC